MCPYAPSNPRKGVFGSKDRDSHRHSEMMLDTKLRNTSEKFEKQKLMY
jgi:hypothetical protein